MFVLPMGQYRARFLVESGLKLPGFLGSTIRGAFGHALKNAVCVTRLERCEPCLLYRTCPYTYIFETPPPPSADKMRLYRAAPPPLCARLTFPGT